MSLEVRPIGTAVAPSPALPQAPGPQSAVVELIKGLQGRIRELEEGLCKERLKYNVNAGQCENLLMLEGAKRAQLDKELGEAKRLLGELTKELEKGAQINRQLEAQHEQDVKIISANRMELTALNERVALLQKQFDDAIVRANTLQIQMNAVLGQLIELTTQVKNLQGPHLVVKQEQRRVEEARQEEAIKVQSQPPSIQGFVQWFWAGLVEFAKASPEEQEAVNELNRI
jgi:hypothetical protein